MRSPKVVYLSSRRRPRGPRVPRLALVEPHLVRYMEAKPEANGEWQFVPRPSSLPKADRQRIKEVQQSWSSSQ